MPGVGLWRFNVASDPGRAPADTGGFLVRVSTPRSTLDRGDIGEFRPVLRIPNPVIRNRMIVLGIDPGSRATGYGFVDRSGSEEALVESGVIRLDGADDHPDRLKQIYDALTTLIDEHRPESFAIEMPVYGKNPQSMLKLGRAQAAAMMAALNAGLPVAQYTPKEVKKSVTGNGNASKAQVGSMVRSILSIPSDVTLAHDAADALAIALCHGNRDAHGDEQTYTGWESFVSNNPDRVSD